MTNLFSGLLAIIIALTSMCGGLSGAQLDKPVSIEINVGVDGDFSSLGDKAAAVDTIKGLINDLSIRFAADPQNVAQLEVLLAGNSAASLSVKKQDDGTWAAVSTLFPNTKLTVADETIQAMLSAGGSNPLASLQEKFDPEAMAALTAPLTELAAGFAEKAGEPETGTFEINGVVYTTKIPYNLTTKEAATMVLEALKKILSDEKVASMFSQFNIPVNADSIDSALENIANADEADQPVLSAAIYTNEAGDKCIEILLVKDEESMSFVAAKVGSTATVDFDMLGQAKGSIKLDTEAKTFDMDISFVSGGTSVALKVNAAITDEGGNFDIAADIASGEKKANLKLGIKMTYDAPVYEEADGLKTVAMETLMTADETSEDAAAFMTDFQTGAMTLLMNVAQQYPEFAQLMNSASTESAPAE